MEAGKTTLRLTAVISLPAIVGFGAFSVHEVNGGRLLEFKCIWPKQVIDVETLNKKFLLAEKVILSYWNWNPF